MEGAAITGPCCQHSKTKQIQRDGRSPYGGSDRKELKTTGKAAGRRTAELTQILPVSIPRDSLLVSRLKDIQEHGAVNIQNTAMTGLYVSTLFWEICFQKNWDPFYCNLCRCSAAVNFEQHFFVCFVFFITNSLKSVTHQQLLLLL